MNPAPDPVAPAETDPGASGQRGGDAELPIDSQQLLQGRREVVILHRGQQYRLQVTRAGKLILVK